MTRAEAVMIALALGESCLCAEDLLRVCSSLNDRGFEWAWSLYQETTTLEDNLWAITVSHHDAPAIVRAGIKP